MTTMTRWRSGRQRVVCRAGLLVMLMMTQERLIRADEAPAAAPAKTESPKNLELVVDPAPEPSPALRYRLLLPGEMRRPGNAAPIYLRLLHEQDDKWRQHLSEDTEALLDVPLDAMPLDEAERHLDSFAAVLGQLSAAGHRSDCDWEYVFENQDPLLIPLNDAQFMRAYARLLWVKTRLEIRSGKFDEAIGTMQDGLALAQHVATAPFLVSRLIGLAASNMTLVRVEELLRQPAAPNLYWALAALPRPMIRLDGALVFEGRMLELKFPELDRLAEPRSTEDWQRLSQSLRNWAAEVAELELVSPHAPGPIVEKTRATPTPLQLESARTYLRDKCRLPAAQVQAMSDAEIEVRHTVALYHEMSDSWQKWFLLPYPDSLSRLPALIESLRDDVKRRELYPLSSMLLVELANVLRAQARVDRQVARLQTIEALRMHAAATGTLPVRLDEITIVPVPLDPVTGKAFLYSRDKDVAVLDVTDQAGMADDASPWPVRIRLRGK